MKKSTKLQVIKSKSIPKFRVQNVVKNHQNQDFTVHLQKHQIAFHMLRKSFCAKAVKYFNLTSG